MKTPLFESHMALGARMGLFADFELPIQFDGILIEHNRTRTQSSIFDVCHMGEFMLRGPSAEADLDRLLTQNLRTMQVGQARYGYLLREDGGTLDDLICYRRGPERFMLVVNAGNTAKDRAWIRGRLSPATAFEDVSADTGKIDIQGPASQAALESAFATAIPNLGYFRAAEVDLGGCPCLLSRTGYTGEWGYELFAPAENVRALWDRLIASGAVRPAGLGARDTLRLEMGFPLHGHELTDERSPLAVGQGRFVDWDKAFVGKAALEGELQRGSPALVVGLQLTSRRAARPGDAVYSGGERVGEVTSGSLAPSLDVAVALALVDADFSQPGQQLEVRVRRRHEPCRVVNLPFYKSGTARGVARPRP